MSSRAEPRDLGTAGKAWILRQAQNDILYNKVNEFSSDIDDFFYRLAVGVLHALLLYTGLLRIARNDNTPDNLAINLHGDFHSVAD